MNSSIPAALLGVTLLTAAQPLGAREPLAWVSAVPFELRHATASSISAPGERCYDPLETVCAAPPVTVQPPGGPLQPLAPQPLAAPPLAQTSLAPRDLGLLERLQQSLFPEPGSQVEVVIDTGTATLSGTVASAVERRMLTIRAMGVVGVHHVVDRLQIREAAR